MSSLRPSILRLLAVLGLAASVGACNPPATMQGKVAVADRGGGDASATLPITFASRRPMVELVLLRPDGSERRALAWVNMGAPAPILSKRLYRELGIDRGHDLAIRLGGLAITVVADSVTDGPGELDGRDLFSLLFAPREVEAVLPAGVLRQFQMVLDPAGRTLTLARPGVLKPVGTPVPVRVNDATGIVTVEANVPGASVPLALDAGAPYTWLRGSTAAAWLRSHPDWYRADGAVGRSNLAMADLGLERSGTVIRLPNLQLGGLVLHDVGALGTGPLLGQAGDAVLGEVFWDTWQKATGGPVAGWIGGNVLGDYRLMVDYPAGMTYWQRQRPADAHDLDGVGLTLVRLGDGYGVGGIAERHGERLVEGVEPGDRLLGVNGTPLEGAAPEHVLTGLSGRPGERRRLELLHGGQHREVEASVTRF